MCKARREVRQIDFEQFLEIMHTKKMGWQKLWNRKAPKGKPVEKEIDTKKKKGKGKRK